MSEPGASTQRDAVEIWWAAASDDEKRRALALEPRGEVPRDLAKAISRAGVMVAFAPSSDGADDDHDHALAPEEFWAVLDEHR